MCTQKWDFFIAHAASDKIRAERIYSYLNEFFSVFIDTKCIKPGDDWDITISNAQKESFVSLILISCKTNEAYYQREEIASAISLSRTDDKKHKVIPVYLDKNFDKNNVPYGLRIKQGFIVTKKTNLKKISFELINMFKNEFLNKKNPSLCLEEKPNNDMVEKKYKIVVETVNGNRKKKNCLFENFDNYDVLLDQIECRIEKGDTLIWIDLDKFTSINKKYGRKIANSIIKKVITIIEETVRDDMCHLLRAHRRDDFFIITNCSRKQNISETIINSISSYNWNSLVYGMYVHCSIGLGTMYKYDEPNPSIVIAKSKISLNNAKAWGGNCIGEDVKIIGSKYFVNIHDS